jgi:hypothetical protein
MGGSLVLAPAPFPGGKIRRIEDYLERGAALAAAGIKGPCDSR